MSYKTPVKSLRYGFSSDWAYKGVGSVKNSLVAEKIGQYVGNVVSFVVPPTPKRTRTRGVQIKKVPAQPGIQGRTVVMDTSKYLNILVFYYLNFTELSDEQSQTVERNFNQLVYMTTLELGNSRIYFCNYFDFFFYTRLAISSGNHSLRENIKKFFKSRPNSKFAVEIGKKKIQAFNMLHLGVARFKRQQYVKRSLPPIAAAFFFSDCDSELLVRVIAFELQTLRVFHRRFVNFVRAFFKTWIGSWSEPIRIVQGIRLEIKGRLTLFRRQIQRASANHFRFGIVKKAHFITESISSQAIALNRYGTISVNIHCEIKKKISERWEERNFNSSLNFFSMRESKETILEFHPQYKQKFFFTKAKNTKGNLNEQQQEYTIKFHRIWNFNRRQSIMQESASALSKAPSTCWLLRPTSYLLEHKNETVILGEHRFNKKRLQKINWFSNQASKKNIFLF